MLRKYLASILASIVFSSCTTDGVNTKSHVDQLSNDLVLQIQLECFDGFEKSHPGPIPSSIQIKSGKGSHLLIGCMVHGDEVGCLPAVLNVIEKLESRQIKFSGTFTTFIGNRKAAEAGKRFLEQDLNRAFSKEAPPSTEKTRAAEIMSLAKSADLFIDLHQTIEPTDHAFYTFAFREIQYQWAKYLEGAEILITRSPNIIFAAGSLTATEYAANHGIPAVTLELNQKGFSELAHKQSLNIILRAIDGLGKVKQSRDLPALRKLSKKSRDLRLLKRVANQPFTDSKMQLNSGFKNFSKVKEGEVVGTNGDGSAIKASASGYLLFPKYPSRNEQGEALKPLPSDLFLIQQEAKLEEFQ